MKKVLILANNDAGLYKFRKELIYELLKENSVYISLPTGEFVPLLKEMGCIFIEIPIDRRGTNPFKDIKLLINYIKVIKNIKPDIVLTYTIKPNLYGGLICRFLKYDYISNITGLGTALENNNFLSKILLLLYKLGLSDSKAIFFQNRANMDFFKNNNISDSRSILIPGSGVNLDEYCYEEYPNSTTSIKFIFIGRIMKDKGIEEFLDCAKYIKNKYPSCCFSIVGAYDDENYKNRIDELNHLGIIKYFGQQKDVHAFLRDHHVTILPSYHEGLSNVLLESEAIGRPVIASKIPGCTEAFDDGITGLGFEPKDSSSLIDIVEKFINLPYEEKKEMGLRAREKVEKEFDRRIVIDEYLKTIENLGDK